MNQDRSQDLESIIDELLDRWDECQERGEVVSPEELCRELPELLDEVRSRIGRLAAIDGWMGNGIESGDWLAGKLPMQTKFRELEFLQRGGLGTVYVGDDSVAHRKVAVKFLPHHLAADPVCRDRFLLEAEVTRRLEHPGVIPLYGIGQTPDGYAFYAMRFIDGHSMDEAASPLLRQTLTELNGMAVEAAPDPNRDDGGLDLATLEPQRSALQNWLQSRWIEHQQAVKTESWFVVGSEGTQLVRVRPGSSIGRNFRHRDYFHGRGRDLDPAETVDDTPPKPLSDRIVHMSVAFESTNTHTLMVVFSVPIFDDTAAPIVRRPP